MSRGGAQGAPGGSAPITFGTSGWRGLRDGDFTLPRVRTVARAVADWLAESGAGGEVVIAHDTRPGGDAFSAAASEVLRGRGFSIVRATKTVPTPAAARAVVLRGARAALIFTASHNPPEYAGLKVFGSWGGTLDTDQTRRIEAFAAAPGSDSAATPGPPEVRVDLVAPYVEDLVSEVGARLSWVNPPRVIYDAMHGAGSGVLDRILTRCGVAVRVLRGEALPDFGGGAPEPVAERLRALSGAVRADAGVALGLATDGDADRFAVLDADGRCLSETEALALLVDHLARTGRVTNGIAISVATGTLVERVATDHGLHVERHPVGFKHLTRALRRGEVDAAGEESGGFALGRFGVDKDGILAAALFVEMVATDPAPLAHRLAALEERHGNRVCGRSAVPSDPAAEAALARLGEFPPDCLDGAPIRGVEARDGLYLDFDDGFLMLRASGTEPLIRVYAEAPDGVALRRRLVRGKSLLGGRD